ncbi:MAG: AzlD domain-containing protein [Treponema sp.]|jgi:branched-subunit amino acid transport protein AzlD|nr:AzlD domain-containing protein [Treponema sp.]
MKVSVNAALVMTFAMGAVILFCRVFPFLFFRERKPGAGKDPGPPDLPADKGREDPPSKRTSRRNLRESFLALVEKTAPPAAMTVLAFNAVSAPIKEDLSRALPVLAASAFTAAVHLWKRNALLSILGGTAFYMVLERVL